MKDEDNIEKIEWMIEKNNHMFNFDRVEGEYLEQVVEKLSSINKEDLGNDSNLLLTITDEYMMKNFREAIDVDQDLDFFSITILGDGGIYLDGSSDDSTDTYSHLTVKGSPINDESDYEEVILELLSCLVYDEIS